MLLNVYTVHGHQMLLIRHWMLDVGHWTLENAVDGDSWGK